jgi:hypothetical protein
MPNPLKSVQAGDCGPQARRNFQIGRPRGESVLREFLERRLKRRWLPQALSVLLVVTQIQAAEQAATPQVPAAAPQSSAPQVPATPLPAASLPVEQSLKVRVLAGAGEANDLERRVMAPLVVQVVDQNERAVEGGEVVFRFPISGPSATFPGGKTSITVRTNGGGQAAAVNWMANGQVGAFQVHVNASYGNQVGETTVAMINATRVADAGRKVKHESLWSKRWFKIAVIGGSAVAIGLGVYFGTRGGSKSGSTVTISPGGSPSVGAPH